MLAPISASTSPAYKVVSLRGAAEPSAHGRIVLSLSVYPFAWSVLLNKVCGLLGCLEFLKRLN